MAEAMSRVRKVGGSLMVTIPKEVAAAEGIGEGNLVSIRVSKKRRDFFGTFHGLGSWEGHDGDWGHD